MIRFAAWMFSLSSLGAIMGLGLLAAVLWAYGRDLPDHQALAQYQPATISHVYDGDGRVMAEYFTERRIFAPIDEVPDLVKNAFISAEDRTFYEHSGFDAVGILSALADFAQGERLRGASTITQQVMKNFLLTSERSFERKLREIILATRIEQVLSKDQILELYLNEIFLGARAYGVAAAAANYFGKPLEALTPAESAYLAALPKSPSSLHPVRNREGALDRRDYVLGQMLRNGHIDRAGYDEAIAAPLDTLLDGTLESQLAATPDRGYFTEEIRRQLTERLGRDQVLGGGLAIRATVEPKLQRAAADALRARLESWDRERGGWRGPLASIAVEALEEEADWRAALTAAEAPRDIPGWRPAVILQVGERSARIGIEGVEEDDDGHFIPMRDVRWARPRLDGDRLGREPRSPADVWSRGDVVMVTAVYDGEGDARVFDRWSLRQVPELQGAFMAMDPNTGRVLALQGGFSFQSSVFNRATQARRQPGSAFKPFVYAAALDSGYSPSTVILDAPLVIDTGAAELWRPMNASDRFYGPSPMRVGIEQSRNVMTVRLAQAMGMDRVADYAERFGVYEDMPAHLSYSLGAGETTLYQMVAAYAMFANGGWRIEPTLVDRVQDRRGETVLRHEARLCRDCDAPFARTQALPRTPWPAPNARRIMNPVTAYQLVSMLEGVVQRGTASRLQRLGFPVGGKTGTTNESKDAWFIGFTPNLVAGCYVGYDVPRPMGRGAFGGTLCAPVFQAFMEVAMQDRPKPDFQPPRGMVLVKIDRETGDRLPDDASGPNVIEEPYRFDDIPPIGAYAGIQVLDGGFSAGFGQGGDLPMTLEASAASDAARTSGSAPQVSGGGPTSAAPAPTAPQAPRPPAGGFSSGGLY